MRVLCIDTCEFNHITLEQRPSAVQVGHTYSVIEEVAMFNNTYYAFAEFGEAYGFEAKAFIPLSDIDETIIHQERFQPTI